MPLTPEEEAELAALEALETKEASGLTPEEEAELAALEQATEPVPDEGDPIQTFTDFMESLQTNIPVVGPAVDYATDALTSVSPLEERSFEEIRQDRELEQEERALRSPVADTIGGLAGSMVAPGGPAFKAAQGAGKLARTGALAGTVAAQGGTQAGLTAADLAARGQLEDIPEAATLTGAMGAAMPVAGATMRGIGGTIGKVEEGLMDLAADQAEKATGMGLSAKSRREIEDYLLNGKIAKGDIGRQLLDEKIITAGVDDSRLAERIMEKRTKVGEEIGGMLERANPIESGAVRRRIEEAIKSRPDAELGTFVSSISKKLNKYLEDFKKVENPTLAEAKKARILEKQKKEIELELEKVANDPEYQKTLGREGSTYTPALVKDTEVFGLDAYKQDLQELASIIDHDLKTIKSQVGPRTVADIQDISKQLENLAASKQMVESELMTLTQNPEAISPAFLVDPEALTGYRNSLLQKIEDINSEIKTLTKKDRSVAIPAMKVNELKSEVGTEIGDFNAKKLSSDKKAALEVYKSYAEELGEAVDDREAYEALNKKYEIIKFLEDSAYDRATRTDRLSGEFTRAGVAMGNPKLIAAGLTRSLWNKYGNSLAAAGFKNLSQLTKIPKKSAIILAEAAKRGSSAVRATHYSMLQRDKEYREAITKAQSEETKE